MNTLITGGSGFIGSHLVDRLLAQGHKITIIDRTPLTRDLINNKIQFVLGNFSDAKLLKNILKDIDIIFHLAWTTIPNTSNDDPVEDISSNLIGTIKLIESALESGVKRFIFNSTGGAVYGNSSADILTEDNIPNPISSYGITKLTAEKYLSLFHHLNKLDYVIFRTSNAYGPRQNPQSGLGFITTALYSLVKQKSLYIWGDGSATRDYIYIDDIIRAFQMATNPDFPPGLYHLGSGIGLSINELIEIINKLTNTKLDLRYTPSRKCDVSKVILDNSRLRNLGWIPKVTIEKGIFETWRWLTLNSEK